MPTTTPKIHPWIKALGFWSSFFLGFANLVVIFGKEADFRVDSGAMFGFWLTIVCVSWAVSLMAWALSESTIQMK